MPNSVCLVLPVKLSRFSNEKACAGKEEERTEEDYVADYTFPDDFFTTGVFCVSL